MEDDDYNIHDDATLENTIQNKNIPARNQVKDKSAPIKRSLAFNLDENVTYAFRKEQAVNSLINPDH